MKRRVIVCLLFLFLGIFLASHTEILAGEPYGSGALAIEYVIYFNEKEHDPDVFLNRLQNDLLKKYGRLKYEKQDDEGECISGCWGKDSGQCAMAVFGSYLYVIPTQQMIRTKEKFLIVTYCPPGFNYVRTTNEGLRAFKRHPSLKFLLIDFRPYYERMIEEQERATDMSRRGVKF